jgi:hypothetical protein
MDLAATPADRSVAPSWRTSADAESVAVTRTPGIGIEKATLGFGGRGSSFVDGQGRTASSTRTRSVLWIRPATPAAGRSPPSRSRWPLPSRRARRRRQLRPPRPRSRQAARCRPQPVAVAPISSPPLRRRHHGRPASAASVDPGGRRELLQRAALPQRQDPDRLDVAAPVPAQALLAPPGQALRLGPGEYRWIVWPGFGPRSKADYGRRIGRRTFEVRAAGR